MNIKILDALFHFMQLIKRFENILIDKYNLKDIPYNLSGKAFPKKGILEFDGNIVEYNFHGRGCTFKWNEIIIGCNTDASSENQIMVSPWEFREYLKSIGASDNGGGYSMDDVIDELVKLEAKGILLPRKPEDLFSFHTSEDWFYSYKKVF